MIEGSARFERGGCRGGRKRHSGYLYRGPGSVGMTGGGSTSIAPES